MMSAADAQQAWLAVDEISYLSQLEIKVEEYGYA